MFEQRAKSGLVDQAVGTLALEGWWWRRLFVHPHWQLMDSRHVSHVDVRLAIWITACAYSRHITLLDIKTWRMLAPRVWFCMKDSLDFPCLWHFGFPRVWPALYLTWIGLLCMSLNNITNVSEGWAVVYNLSNVWPIVVGEWIEPLYFIFLGSRFHISALGPDILTDVLGFWSDFLENYATVLHVRLHMCLRSLSL